MSKFFEKGDRVVLQDEYRYLGRRWEDLEAHTVGTVRSVRFQSDKNIYYADVVWDEEVSGSNSSAVDLSALMLESERTVSDEDLNFVYQSLGVKKPTPCPTCGCTCSQTEQ